MSYSLQVGQESDFQFQARMLEEVSRTFALTIPVLPSKLLHAVGNAYLLCRIADTIEDEPTLNLEQKKEISKNLVETLKGSSGAKNLANKLKNQLSTATSQGEYELISEIPRVIRIFQELSPPQRQAIERCVKIMSSGMMEFQIQSGDRGLKDLPSLDKYCYYVAGVVGEMLTDLFCDYSPEINKNRIQLMSLSVSFGQGLQMTNILKDIWEDWQRGSCWLPRDVFQKYDLELNSVAPGQADPRFSSGIQELLGIARHHLDKALQYVLIIPANETGIRQHCLWALGMAVLTLRRIHATPEFTKSDNVKISRRSVKAIMLSTSYMARSNVVLKQFFAILTRKLPHRLDSIETISV